MSPQDWDSVRQLFHDALDLPSAERARFLDSAAVCGEVRSEVESLLRHVPDVDSDSLLKHTVRGPEPAPATAPTIAPGDEVAGRYRIERLLGKGGHSLVFLASDRKTGDQKVVVKVLHTASAAADWLQKKFQQEVVILGKLRHPGVVGVRDCGTLDGGQPFLVTDFVDGVTLRERMRDPIAAALAASIVRQIGAALKAAHDQGVVHRDVKPENVMVGRLDDAIKLIDFGIARMTRPDGSAGSTVAVIAGTVKYMAPEQFVGQSSAASDIYSFGALCYELCTGVVLKEPITPERVRETAALPPRARQLLASAIAIDPAKRPTDAEAFGRAVAEALLGRDSRQRWWRAAIAAMLTLAAGVGLAAFRHGPAARPHGSAQQLTPDSEYATDPALSARGDVLAYASDRDGKGPSQIWVQSPPGSAPRRLTSEAGGATEPTVSPDGSQVVYRSAASGGGLYVVSMAGGTRRKLTDHGRRPRFSPDGKSIAYYVFDLWSGHCRVYVADLAGGTPRLVKTMAFCRYSAGSPVWSPEGRKLLLWCDTADESGERFADWWVVDLETGKATRTLAFSSFRVNSVRPYYQVIEPEAWSGSDVLFSGLLDSSMRLWSIPLSSKTGMAQDILRSAVDATVGHERRAALGGMTGGRAPMAFSSFNDNIDVFRVPIDANRGVVKGRAERITDSADRDLWPSASADGRMVAYISETDTDRSVHVRDLTRGTDRIIATDVRLWPRISPDGSQVAYSKIEDGKRLIYVSDTAAGGRSKRLCEKCGVPHGWTPDGTEVLVDTSYDFLTWKPSLRDGFDFADVRTGRRTFIGGEHYLVTPRLSPDRKWLAFYIFRADRVEGNQVFVAHFDAPGQIAPQDRWIAITDGAAVERNPDWSPDGKLLYYLSERDGSRCVWARRLDPATKAPQGEPFAVHHSHAARLSMLNALHETATGLTVTRDHLVFSQGARSGSIWMTTFQSHN